MRIGINKDGTQELREVYNGITLVTNAGEELSICMRDSGFEFTYQGVTYSAKGGTVDKCFKYDNKAIINNVSITDSASDTDLVTNSPDGSNCPNCGFVEVDASASRTFYACGSSDYDQRPGTFVKGVNCIEKGIREALYKVMNMDVQPHEMYTGDGDDWEFGVRADGVLVKVKLKKD